MKQQIERLRLPELDGMRVLAALAVLALHVLGYYLATLPAGSSESMLARALVLCLRFARQAFMFVTGFVLTLSLLCRPFAPGPFLVRRARAVLLPYLAWSLVYFAVARHFGLPSAAGPWLPALVRALAWGDGFYHLYYLAVTLQAYLVLPLAVPLLRRLGPGGAVAGLAAVIGAYPLLMAAWPVLAGAEPGIVWYQDRVFLSYLPYFAAGMVAGAHPRAWQAWVQRRGAACAAGAGLVLAYLLADLARRPHAFAEVISVFRPALVAYGLLGSVALCCAAGWVQKHGGRLQAALGRLGPHTFTIFLAHPLVLFAIERYGLAGVPSRLWHALPLMAGGLAGAYALARLLSVRPSGRPRPVPDPPGECQGRAGPAVRRPWPACGAGR